MLLQLRHVAVQLLRLFVLALQLRFGEQLCGLGLRLHLAHYLLVLGLYVRGC